MKITNLRNQICGGAWFKIEKPSDSVLYAEQEFWAGWQQTPASSVHPPKLLIKWQAILDIGVEFPMTDKAPNYFCHFPLLWNFPVSDLPMPRFSWSLHPHHFPVAPAFAKQRSRVPAAKCHMRLLTGNYLCWFSHSGRAAWQVLVTQSSTWFIAGREWRLPTATLAGNMTQKGSNIKS